MIFKKKKLEETPPIELLNGESKRTFRPLLQLYDFINTYIQKYRVQDTSLERYELFVGIDEEPNLKAEPDEVSASLPFNYTLTPPVSGTRVFHCIVRKRNSFNLSSFNQWSTKVEIDNIGEEVLGEITAPINIRLLSTNTSGGLKVLARYMNGDRNSPDTWKIWASEGSEPNPALDTPVYSGAMSFSGAGSALQKEISSFTPGAVVHVIVGVYRTADGEGAVADSVSLLVPEALTISSGGTY